MFLSTNHKMKIGAFTTLFLHFKHKVIVKVHCHWEVVLSKDFLDNKPWELISHINYSIFLFNVIWKFSMAIAWVLLLWTLILILDFFFRFCKIGLTFTQVVINVQQLGWKRAQFCKVTKRGPNQNWAWKWGQICKCPKVISHIIYSSVFYLMSLGQQGLVVTRFSFPVRMSRIAKRRECVLSIIKSPWQRGLCFYTLISVSMKNLESEVFVVENLQLNRPALPTLLMSNSLYWRALSSWLWFLKDVWSGSFTDLAPLACSCCMLQLQQRPTGRAYETYYTWHAWLISWPAITATTIWKDHDDGNSNVRICTCKSG